MLGRAMKVVFTYAINKGSYIYEIYKMNWVIFSILQASSEQNTAITQQVSY